MQSPSEEPKFDANQSREATESLFNQDNYTSSLLSKIQSTQDMIESLKTQLIVAKTLLEEEKTTVNFVDSFGQFSIPPGPTDLDISAYYWYNSPWVSTLQVAEFPNLHRNCDIFKDFKPQQSDEKSIYRRHFSDTEKKHQGIHPQKPDSKPKPNISFQEDVKPNQADRNDLGKIKLVPRCKFCKTVEKKHKSGQSVEKHASKNTYQYFQTYVEEDVRPGTSAVSKRVLKKQYFDAHEEFKKMQESLNSFRRVCKTANSEKRVVGSDVNFLKSFDRRLKPSKIEEEPHI